MKKSLLQTIAAANILQAPRSKPEDLYAFAGFNGGNGNGQEAVLSIGDGVKVVRDPTQGKSQRLSQLISFLKTLPVSKSGKEFPVVFNWKDKYFSKGDCSTPVFCYCKPAYGQGILVPTHDFVTGFAWKLLDAVESSDIPLHEKVGQSIFCGSSTGDGSRLKFCDWVAKKPQHTAYITNSVQSYGKSTPEERDKKYKHWKEFTIDRPISISDQLKFKYLVNINGNATCWSRFLWQMASNSLCVKIRTNDDYVEWFYPLLTPDVEYLDATFKSFDRRIEKITEGEVAYMSAAGRLFIKKFFTDRNITKDYYNYILTLYRDHCLI